MRLETLASIFGQVPSLPGPLHGFSPTLILVLNLVGTFVFGLSGGLAAARARLDLFGAIVLAVVVGLAGGVLRDVLIGIPPATIRDWRYPVVAGGAGLVAAYARPLIDRLARPIATMDAAGLGLYCVTGAAIALAHRLGVVESIVLGMISAIGGGILRDVLIGEIPEVLRSGLYAIPACLGAAIVVASDRLGDRSVVFPIVGALVCFAVRMAGLHYGLGVPRADAVGLRGLTRFASAAQTEEPSGRPDPD